MRTPTEKQYARLRAIAGGAAGLSWTKRMAGPFLNHGWVTADWDGSYYQWARITPDGLRALALAVERYGLPKLGPKAVTHTRVCASCGDNRFRFEEEEIEVPV